MHQPSRRTLTLDAFERAFENSAAGSAIIEAVDFARRNGFPQQEFEMRSAVAQAMRELERQALIAIPAGADEADPDEALLYQAYLGVAVLKTMLTKAGLELGAATATEIINAIDMRHPEFAGRSALRSAGGPQG